MFNRFFISLSIKPKLHPELRTFSYPHSAWLRVVLRKYDMPELVSNQYDSTGGKLLEAWNHSPRGRILAGPRGTENGDR